MRFSSSSVISGNTSLSRGFNCPYPFAIIFATSTLSPSLSMSMIFMKSSTVPSISSYPSAVYSFSTFLLSSFAYTFRLIIALFSPFVFEKGDDIRAAALMVFVIQF